jgi:hypothetical protein
MTDHIGKIIKIAGPALSQNAPQLGRALRDLAGPLTAELIGLLTAKKWVLRI